MQNHLKKTAVATTESDDNNGDEDGNLAPDASIFNGEDEKEKPTGEEKKKEDDALKDKIKAFLANKSKVADLAVQGISFVQSIVLPWLHKKQLFPEDELAQLPAYQAKIIELANQENSSAEIAALQATLNSINERQKKLESYVESIAFTEEEISAVKAVVEHKINSTNLVEMIEKYPLATIVIGVAAPRVLPLIGYEFEKRFLN